MKRKLSIIASLLLSSSVVFAGGFQVNMQGVRQVAMGGSSTALAYDIASIFYNPGALAKTAKGTQVYFSANGIFAKTTFVSTPTAGYTSQTDNPMSTPFNLYLSHKLNDKIALGFGVYTPFGSTVNWGNTNANSLRYLIEKIELRNINFQPTISYQVNDKVSIGAGLVYATGSVVLEKGIPLFDPNGKEGLGHLEGKANSIGFNMGAHAQLNDRLTLGVSYRSQVRFDITSGDATFTVPSSLAANFPTTTFSASLPMPQVASLGLGYKVNNKLTLQGEMNFVGWESYKSLDFTYAKTTTTLLNSTSPRNWENVFIFRLGAHYQYNDKLELMAGIARDPSPVKDGYFSAETPDANRFLGTAGLVYKVSDKINLMASYYYTQTDQREVYNNADAVKGKIQTTAVAGGIGVSYKF
ncbi:MAG: hypothetical protein RL624_742 [Bacteroidota bacterium]|jgi:long-chain fatty acid transport protein